MRYQQSPNASGNQILILKNQCNNAHLAVVYYNLSIEANPVDETASSIEARIMFMQMKIARLKATGLNSYLMLGAMPLILGSLAACDAFSTDTKSQDEIRVEPRVLRNSDLEILPQQGSGSGENRIVEVDAAYRPGDEQEQQNRIAITGSDAIPYPIYPDAKQYRIGGENGLHVVLFETNDSFEEVDSFYQRYSGSKGYSRLVGMADYVRYDTTREAASSNSDAWKNDKPGIVIHGFTDQDEATQSGATPGAKTNIIVSY